MSDMPANVLGWWLRLVEVENKYDALNERFERLLYQYSVQLQQNAGHEEVIARLTAAVLDLQAKQLLRNTVPPTELAKTALGVAARGVAERRAREAAREAEQQNLVPEYRGARAPRPPPTPASTRCPCGSCQRANRVE